MEHLEAMDYLRGSVNLRAYGQRDPLVEYKKEGLRLYKDLEFSLFDTILKHLERVAPAAAAFTPIIDLSQVKEGGPESAQVLPMILQVACQKSVGMIPARAEAGRSTRSVMGSSTKTYTYG